MGASDRGAFDREHLAVFRLPQIWSQPQQAPVKRKHALSTAAKTMRRRLKPGSMVSFHRFWICPQMWV